MTEAQPEAMGYIFVWDTLNQKYTLSKVAPVENQLTHNTAQTGYGAYPSQNDQQQNMFAPPPPPPPGSTF